ncbi:hypothetical protein [Chitinilyticum litopenaei]|uniref:hypothetical protein n=1 Tax=Chitinilyticum litopenaei TaxID=1121276 RepID=UPI00040CD987|nr:hypothetical protein [Chitinilyticum litopenaei]
MAGQRSPDPLGLLPQPRPNGSLTQLHGGMSPDPTGLRSCAAQAALGGAPASTFADDARRRAAVLACQPQLTAEEWVRRGMEEKARRDQAAAAELRRKQAKLERLRKEVRNYGTEMAVGSFATFDGKWIEAPFRAIPFLVGCGIAPIHGAINLISQPIDTIDLWVTETDVAWQTNDNWGVAGAAFDVVSIIPGAAAAAKGLQGAKTLLRGSRSLPQSMPALAKTTVPRIKPAPDNYASYVTHGLKTNPLDLEEGRHLIRELQKQGMDQAQALTKARELLASGSTVPKAASVSPGEKLYKLVPEGEMPGARSAFWATKDEVAALKGMSRDQIADRLGIPLESQQLPRFDVVEITATRPTTTFSSTIAPTTQNGWEQAGGGIQTLVTDRGAFTPPVATGSKLP